MMTLSGLRFFTRLQALKIAQTLLLFIPAAIMVSMFAFSSGKALDIVLINPVLTVSFIIALTHLFCYLLLKQIRKELESHRTSQLLPLWLLFTAQIFSANVLCAGLVAYGVYQEYGRDMLHIKWLRIDRDNRSVVLGFVPLMFLYAFLLFIRIRLTIATCPQ